ncbi:MAG: ATP-dependent DNA helicase RecG [Bacteroidota bacterium]
MKLLHEALMKIPDIGYRKAKLLYEELGLETVADCLTFYPYKYEDRSEVYDISDLSKHKHPVGTEGIIEDTKVVVTKSKKRFVALLKKAGKKVELVWFNRTEWWRKEVQTGHRYYVFGQVRKNKGKLSMTHPEIVRLGPTTVLPKGILPIYSTTKKLLEANIDNTFITKVQRMLSKKIIPFLNETLPQQQLENHALMPRKEALSYIHFSPSKKLLARARYRLKLEELIYLQTHLLQCKKNRKILSKGMTFKEASLLKKYYDHHLSFTLTNDQKKVIREICKDMRSGNQMNRLLQGDVGSGKTIVAFLSGLVPLSSGAQVALVAPTEVLAKQHQEKLKPEAAKLGLSLALLTGSTSSKERKQLLKQLSEGSLHIIVGTHALLQEDVRFTQLGLAIIDEQHRFGVVQRAKLWKKNTTFPCPHILVMTATPIPRTLAKALYGDLDVSCIKEKPAGRKPILTTHYYDRHRLVVFERMREELAKGHQVYIVYPRILSSDGEEENKDLMDGYESISRAFPKVPISILHGKMVPTSKAFEMSRFVKGETKIMVGTTILEVGINVPNATTMVIENAESFGLAQLHQLRGRVGRDEKPSYCLLLTKDTLSTKARQRINAMVRTNDGFEIAQIDLQSRGPGDILGIQQSGLYNMKLADLTKDKHIIEKAHTIAQEIIEADPFLSNPENKALKQALEHLVEKKNWSIVS